MRSATCAGPACPRDAPLRQEPVYICMEKTKNAHAEEKKAERQRAQTVLSTLVTNLEQHYILSQRHPQRPTLQWHPQRTLSLCRYSNVLNSRRWSSTGASSQDPCVPNVLLMCC